MTADGRSTAEIQILVRDLVDQHVRLNARRWFFFGSLMVLVTGLTLLWLVISPFSRTVDSANSIFAKTAEARLSQFRQEMTAIRSEMSRSLDDQQGEIDRTLAESKWSIAETRTAVNAANAMLIRGQSELTAVDIRIRTRVANSQRLASNSDQRLLTSKTALRRAAELQKNIDTTVSHLSNNSDIVSQANVSADLAPLMTQLVHRDELHQAVLDQVGGAVLGRAELTGTIRVVGSLQVEYPIENQIASTIFLPGIVRFTSPEGGLLRGSSIKIIGEAEKVGILRVMGPSHHEAVRITYNNLYPQYPNAGIVLLFANSSGQKQQAGVYLETNDIFRFATIVPDGEWRSP